MSMFPDNFEVPSSSSKFLRKFEEGDTKILMLTKPILGWKKQEFGDDNKPVEGSFDIWSYPDQKTKPHDKAQFFMGFMAYNHRTNEVCYCEMTQKGLINDLANLDRNEYDLLDTDVVITRKGSTRDNTEYKVAPVAPRSNIGLSEEIKAKFAEVKFDLDKVFKDGNPFPKNGEGEAETEKPKTQATKALNEGVPEHSIEADPQGIMPM